MKLAPLTVTLTANAGALTAAFRKAAMSMAAFGAAMEGVRQVTLTARDQTARMGELVRALAADPPPYKAHNDHMHISHVPGRSLHSFGSAIDIRVPRCNHAPGYAGKCPGCGKWRG